MNIKSILSAAVLSLAISSASAQVLEIGEVVYDDHGTEALVVSQDQIRQYWDDFIGPDGIREKLHAKGYTHIDGLRFVGSDVYGNQVEAHRLADTIYQEYLPAKWTGVIDYVELSGGQYIGETAFYPDEHGNYLFYRPGEAKF